MLVRSATHGSAGAVAAYPNVCRSLSDGAIVLPTRRLYQQGIVSSLGQWPGAPQRSVSRSTLKAMPAHELRSHQVAASACVGTDDIAFPPQRLCPSAPKPYAAGELAGKASATSPADASDASTRAPSLSPTSGKSRTPSEGSCDCEVLGCGEPSTGVDASAADTAALARKIWPHRGCAHRLSDVQLLVRFLALAQVSDVNDSTVKLLLRALKQLWCMELSAEEVCSVLAHASSYFPSVSSLCGGRMSRTEVGNVLVVLVYLAHTWVLDQTCRLSAWHRQLFSTYCSLETLEKSVFHMLKLRGYTLRVDDEDLHRRYEALAPHA